MTGLFIFFLIYITMILVGVSGIWYLMNNYEAIIFRRDSVR